MRFLIVGASGLVGRHLFRQCRAAGHATLGTQCRTHMPGLETFDLAQERIGDCLRRSPLPGDGPAVAVVCAGISQIDRCLRERELCYRVNVTNTMRLLEDASALGFRPVFLSTGFIFEGTAGHYAEEAPPGPINEYGRQKLAVEEFISRESPGALVVRLDKVIGDDPGEAHLFTEWYRAAAEGGAVVCIAGQEFSPTLVGDIAQAILLASERGLRGVYHVANPECCSREELARQFLRCLGKPSRVETRTQESLGFADLRPLKTCLDGTKFTKATGMQFTTAQEAIHGFLARLPVGR
jgi:dTDP-4-dehydrorhamnose reductase